jgi:CRP-like cAMP-binding protein
MIPEPFHLLPSNAVSKLALSKGQHAFSQGDIATGLLIVLSGRMKLVRHTETGHQVVLFRAGAGDTIAEASLFSTHYHCDCVATQEATLLRLDKASLMVNLRNNPDFSMALMQRLARQVQGYRRQLEVMSLKSAQDRVMGALADFGLQGTVMTFAASIGLSHEVTYRTLSALVKCGKVIRTGRGKYAVALQLK